MLHWLLNRAIFCRLILQSSLITENLHGMNRTEILVCNTVCYELIVTFSATLCTVATALVSSRLDYANSILYGIPAKHTSRLQRTQNTLARVVTGTVFTDSSLSTLKRLHWLPIDARIRFKIATHL